MFKGKLWHVRAKERMKKLRLTQKDLSEEIGVTRGAIGHYLSGRREPTVDSLMKIIQVLDVSADWLLFGKRGRK